jgi:hypothetical protein
LDRIYLSGDLMARNLGIETTMAAFREHLAVVLRLTLDEPIVRRGRCTWKLNSALLVESHIMGDLRQNGYNGNGNNNSTRTTTSGGLDIVKNKSG